MLRKVHKVYFFKHVEILTRDFYERLLKFNTISKDG